MTIPLFRNSMRVEQMKSFGGLCWLKGLIIIPVVVCLFVLMSAHPVFAQDKRTYQSDRNVMSPSTSLLDGNRQFGGGGIGGARSSMLGGGKYGRQGNSGLPRGFDRSGIGGRCGSGDFRGAFRNSPAVNKPILAQMYDDSFTGSYRNWYQPEAALDNQVPIAVRRDLNSDTQKAENSTKTLPLEQLVKNYILSHQQNYLQLGWKQFQDGEYRVACDTFMLADSVSYDTLKNRSLVKLAILQAAVASRQYMLASGSLKWLITPDSGTKQLPNPDFLSQIKNARTNYGIESDFDKHVLFLNLYARNNVESAELTALRSVVLWSRGDRSDALHYAGQLSQMVRSELDPQRTVWMQLYTLMTQAERMDGSSERTEEGRESGSSSKLPTSVPLDLPFDLPGG